MDSFGCIPSKKDIRDYKLAASAVVPINFPVSYRLKPIQIKNQKNQLTCTAHALASAIEFFNLRDTCINERFSTDFIYGFRTEEDYLGEGMALRDGLKIVQKYGDVLYNSVPGNTNVPTARKKVFSNYEQLISLAKPNRISTYYKINSINEIKYAILYDGPVIACMKWFKDVNVGADGIYRYSKKELKDYHAVLVVGWNKKNLIVQNSWGKSWGKNGIFYVPINKINEIFVEFYGMTDKIGKVVEPKPVVKKFGKLVNFVLNLNKRAYPNG